MSLLDNRTDADAFRLRKGLPAGGEKNQATLARALTNPSDNSCALTIGASTGARIFKQPDPATMTTVASITIAAILAGIITATPTATGATVAYTLPLPALIEAAENLEVNDAFDWTIQNLALAAADTITITAATGHTIVGNPIVQSLHVTTGGITGNSARYRTRKTAAATFITYRIA